MHLFARGSRRTLTLVVFTLAIAAPSAQAVSPDIVVSQVYGGGGNSGATYTNDFVELFNRGAAPVDVSGWSVQYASAAGSTWQLRPLSATIAPGARYLVADGSLVDLPRTLPAPERYTYVFEGNAQVLDHILISRALADAPGDGGYAYDIVHTNSEFADQASDHDPQVVRLKVTG